MFLQRTEQGLFLILTGNSKNDRSVPTHTYMCAISNQLTARAGRWKQLLSGVEGISLKIHGCKTNISPPPYRFKISLEQQRIIIYVRSMIAIVLFLRIRRRVQMRKHTNNIRAPYRNILLFYYCLVPSVVFILTSKLNARSTEEGRD
jgi:hypothetical protein